MVRTLRRSLLLLILLTGTVVTAAVPTVKPPARPLDLSKLPPNTIIVIGDDAKDALQQPGVIVLTPEKFKELLDQIDQLKKQANPDKPEPPSRCKINGRVDGDVVTLQLQYEFETRRRRAQVSLGGQKVSANTATAWPTAVSLDDGRLPLLPPPGDDGLAVQVDAPGAHKLALDVELLVSPRGTKGSERGFEMGLPKAAITSLESLDVPDSVAELRCNGRPVTAKDIKSSNGQRRPVPLGAADRIDVVWKGPAPQQADPLKTAVGTFDVRVEESQITLQGDLSLQMKSGQTDTWQILAPPPPQGSIDPEVPPGDARAPAVTPPAADAKVPVWTVKLREPSDEPLKLRVSARQPRAGKTVAVVPLAVVGAVHQNGTLTVSAPPELRYRARPKGEVSQRDLPEEVRRAAGNVALFSYWNLPATRADHPAASVLELDVEPVKGAVETETTYLLRLTEEGWQVTATFDVTPVRSAVEKLDVDLPSEYALKAGPALLVEPEPEVKDPNAPRRTGVLKLAQKQSRPFKLTLEGVCPLAKGAPPALVPLPRPLQTLDRGARVTVVLPEATELVSVREPGAEPLPPDKQERAWKLPKAAPRVEVLWRTRRAELPAESQADVTLVDRRALVRQRIRFPAPPEGLKEVVLHSADLPADASLVMDGEPLLAREAHKWAVALPKSATLNLEYSVPLPEPDKGGRSRRFTLPLLWPEGATRCLTRVRVWSDPGTQPVPAGGRWEEQPTEIVPQRDRLPALVLRGSGVEVPLVLTLAEPSGASLAMFTADRTLIQAAVSEDGRQNYRARFLLGRVASRHLDIELPAPAGVVNLEVLLDGQGITTVQAVDEDGKESDTGRVARVAINPELYRKPTVLDVRYQLAPGRVEGGNRLQTTLSPPRLRGNVLTGQVRWLVSLPPEWVAVCPGSHVSVEQRWGWRGNLPAPRPAATAADLERWFHVGDSDAEGRLPVTDLVCTQPGPGPLVLLHASQQSWLLGCSLVFITLGLTLYFAALPKPVLWPLVVLLALGALAVGLLWPGVLPSVVYGCEPGAVVLVVVIGMQWLLHRRYRRQLVFMPGFSRLAPGSSIVRSGGSGSRLRGDPSTVDAPHGAAH